MKSIADPSQEYRFASGECRAKRVRCRQQRNYGDDKYGDAGLLRMQRGRRQQRKNRSPDKDARPQNIFANDPLLTLEQELQCDLHDTGIVATSTSYITETTLASVVDEPIRIRKLRMVEDIECFCPKLQLSSLGNGGAL
jgi:hypothetical protein